MLKGICTTVAAPLLSVVTGTVQDASTGEAVIGAAVILQNTTYGAVADADGRFVINNVKPGTYTIEVQMLSYQRVVIEGCQIKPGENTLPLISLQPSAEEIDEVVVTTVRRLSSEAAVMQAVRNSKMVVSGVSKQMIARTQDRDAGEVVRRIPGISIIDDKFIVARGLSQRYNNVWVNDAAIPSSEADSRAFSFDLIPAGQIENIMILKSPVPEIPADFTGGFVKTTPKIRRVNYPSPSPTRSGSTRRPSATTFSTIREAAATGSAATTASAACGVVLRVLLITTIRISLPT